MMRLTLLAMLGMLVSGVSAQENRTPPKPSSAGTVTRGQVTQESGNCSPNIANVQGNATIHVTCPAGMNPDQLQAALNKALAPILKELRSSDERTLELINQALEAQLQKQMQSAVQNQAEYVRRYQEALTAALGAYSTAGRSAAPRPKPTDIAVSVESWPRREYRLNKTAVDGGTVEFSTDGGKNFKPLERALAVPAVGDISLVMRAIDSSGTETLRVDKTAFVRSELSRQARTSIPKLHNTATSGFYWGCSLYGCTFTESSRGFGFCSAGVSRAFLSDSSTRFSFEVDRSGCTGANAYGTICQEFPHLPFPVSLNKTIYAKFEFVDGTSHVEPLMVDGGVLASSVRGRGPQGEVPAIESWTVLEPADTNSKGPLPFAAVRYAPTNVTVGRYSLFVGLRGCADKGTTVARDGWLVDEDGGGLIRQTGRGGGTQPTFGPQGGQTITADRSAALLGKPALIAIAAETEKGRLGPYSYRFDPKDPIRNAARLAGPARVKCAMRPFGRSSFECTPESRIAWLRARNVKFGPAAGKWTNTLEIRYSLEDFLAHDASGGSPFRFEVPADWKEVFHQITFDDGRVSEIERVPINRR
jgi:hypothetical protein